MIASFIEASIQIHMIWGKNMIMQVNMYVRALSRMLAQAPWLGRREGVDSDMPLAGKYSRNPWATPLQTPGKWCKLIVLFGTSGIKMIYAIIVSAADSETSPAATSCSWNLCWSAQ